MGFFSKIFKGIKKVVKGIGKVIKKVVKSKAFKVIAAVALAVIAPQLIPTIMKGISTISKGVNFMKGQLGFQPTTLAQGNKAVGSNFIKAAQGKSFAPVAKQTFGAKAKAFGSGVLDNLKENAKQMAIDKGKETALDIIAGERKEADLVGTRSYAKSIGAYDSSQGYAPLMNLATNTQSPYLSYSQGQQLFGGLKPATGTP